MEFGRSRRKRIGCFMVSRYPRIRLDEAKEWTKHSTPTLAHCQHLDSLLRRPEVGISQAA